jgi:hypothetical protein
MPVRAREVLLGKDLERTDLENFLTRSDRYPHAGQMVRARQRRGVIEK